MFSLAWPVVSKLLAAAAAILFSSLLLFAAWGQDWFVCSPRRRSWSRGAGGWWSPCPPTVLSSWLVCWGAHGVGLSLPERAPGVGWPVLSLWPMTSRSCLLLTFRPSEASVVGDTESLWGAPREWPPLLSPSSSPTPWTAGCRFGTPHTPPSLLCSTRAPSPLPGPSPLDSTSNTFGCISFFSLFSPFLSFFLPSPPFLFSFLLPSPPFPSRPSFRNLSCVFSIRLPLPSSPDLVPVSCLPGLSLRSSAVPQSPCPFLTVSQAQPLRASQNTVKENCCRHAVSRGRYYLIVFLY